MEQNTIDNKMLGRMTNCEFALSNGFTLLSAENGEVRVEMGPEGKLNGHGVVHGGAIFSLADQAFGIAANIGGEDQTAIAASIQYLAPASGRLEAVAQKVGETAQTSVYEVKVLQDERLIAVFHGTGFKIGSK